ncbi:MAG TPA: dihydroneopterin aldolase [Clostridiaceae bacterium]|nr:dihydroneopterin aldolase [Clostridiaceae bacterium]
MDRIIMEYMAFHGRHGVLPEEKVLGQKFFVDGVLYLDLRKAGETDDLQHTVSYAEVYELIRKVVQDEQYDLLEAVAENICRRVLEEHPLVQKVRIRIRKPEAPVSGIFDSFGVEIERERV